MSLEPERKPKSRRSSRRSRSKSEPRRRAPRSVTDESRSGFGHQARDANPPELQRPERPPKDRPDSARTLTESHRSERPSEGAPASTETAPQLPKRDLSLDYTQLQRLHAERYSGQTTIPPPDAPVTWREALRHQWTRIPELIALRPCIAASVLAGLLLIPSLLLPARGYPKDVCRSHSCNEYARLLTDTLNESADPCYSFTQFVCSGWHRRNQLGVPEVVVTDAIDRMVRLVDAAFLPKTGQDNAQRGLALYRSCDAVVQGKLDELRGVKEALKEAGITWPSRPTKVDIPHVILATSLRLGWDVVFRVVALWRHPPQKTSRVVLLNTGRTIIEILNKTFFSTNLQHRRTYFDVLRRELMSSPINSTESFTFEEVADVENLTVTRLRRAYYKPEVMVPVQIKGILDVPSLGLSRDTWETAFRRFGFNDTVPPSPLQLRTVNTEYVSTFLLLWQELGHAKMHLFISWCTVQVGALFANERLITNFYHADQATVRILHAAFCFSRAFTVSGHQLFTQYNLRSRTASAREDARRVAGAVRSSFRKRLLQWSGYEDNVTVIANWTSLDTLFGLLHGSDHPGSFKPAREDNTWSGGGSGEFDKMYSDLDPNALLSNLRMTSSEVAVSSGEYDTQSDVEVTAVAASLSMLLFSATFYGLPDFQLLPYVLAFPLFDFDQVPGVNFGGFGLEVAKGLSVLTLKAYRKSGPLKANGTIRNCFRSSPLARDTNVFLALGEALGMGALIDAYEQSARSDERYRLRLPDFKAYTGTQMLFIALCLLKCRGSDAGGTPDSICDLPFSHVPEFAQHFHCLPGTRMHPVTKCELI